MAPRVTPSIALNVIISLRCRALQTEEVAGRGSDGFEACGSPGEVASEPSARNLYNIFVTGGSDPPDGYPVDVPLVPAEEVGPALSETALDHLETFNRKRSEGVGALSLKQGKNIAWTMLALGYPHQDQHPTPRCRDRTRVRIFCVFYNRTPPCSFFLIFYEWRRAPSLSATCRGPWVRTSCAASCFRTWSTAASCRCA